MVEAWVARERRAMDVLAKSLHCLRAAWVTDDSYEAIRQGLPFYQRTPDPEAE